MDGSIYLRVKDTLGSGKFRHYFSSNESGATGFKVEKDKKNSTISYTFTWNNESGNYGIAFQLVSKTKLYIADFEVYNVKQPQKNLLPSAENPDTLFGWREDWKVVPAGTTTYKQANGNYIVTVTKYDETAFAPDPILPYKMVYAESYGIHRSLLQSVKLEPGKTYRFSIGTASVMQLQAMLWHKGSREIAINGMKLVNNPDMTKDWYVAEYEFTVPKTVNGKPIDSEMFVGIQLSPGAMAYLFNPQLWEVSDPDRENIFKNSGFNKGLDNWAYGWDAWFIAAKDGFGKSSKEKEGEYKVEVMNYDETKFVTYLDDSKFNDGEWWTSLGEKEIERSGKLNVTVVDPAGNGLKKVELLLKTKDNSYTATTDEEGKLS